MPHLKFRADSLLNIQMNLLYLILINTTSFYVNEAVFGNRSVRSTIKTEVVFGTHAFHLL